MATNVEKVEAGPRGIIISFRDNRFARPDELIRYVTAQGSLAKVRPDMRIVFTGDFEGEDQRMKGVTSLLRDLLALIEKPEAKKKN